MTSTMFSRKLFHCVCYNGNGFKELTRPGIATIIKGESHASQYEYPEWWSTGTHHYWFPHLQCGSYYIFGCCLLEDFLQGRVQRRYGPADVHSNRKHRCIVYSRLRRVAHLQRTEFSQAAGGSRRSIFALSTGISSAEFSSTATSFIAT